MTVVQSRGLKHSELPVGNCDEKSAVCDVGALQELYPRNDAVRSCRPPVSGQTTYVELPGQRRDLRSCPQSEMTSRWPMVDLSQR